MLSNYEYDIIIIGGGISGLFLAFKLLNTDLKVIVLEGDKNVGGRIETIQKNGTIFESGAARFHSSHWKLISLIHDLNLQDDLLRLPDEINSILSSNKKDDFEELLKHSTQVKENYSQKLSLKRKDQLKWWGSQKDQSKRPTEKIKPQKDQIKITIQ